MRSFIAIVLILFRLTVQSQTITFGDECGLYLTPNTDFYVGGDLTFNDTIINEGRIIAFSDIDFGNNQEVGNVKFVGTDDQEVTANDTIFTENFEIDKQNELILSVPRMIVKGSMDATQGVVQAPEGTFQVTGTSMPDGLGFVEGPMFGFATNSGQVTFPVGVNNEPNYVTLLNVPPGTEFKVECRVPDPNSLLPDDEIAEIDPNFEWVISVFSGDSTSTELELDFSGINLQALTPLINADRYDAGIVLYSPLDSLHHVVNPVGTPPDEFVTAGIIQTSQAIGIGSTPIRFSIGLLPVADGPTFYVPNAFAPNGNFSQNRIFRPFFGGGIVTDVSIVVYDSFNREVYSFSDSGTDIDLTSIGWDGTLNSGLDAPAGVYYYSIRIVTDVGVYPDTFLNDPALNDRLPDDYGAVLLVR